MLSYKTSKSIKKYLPHKVRKIVRYYLNDFRNLIDWIEYIFSPIKTKKNIKKYLSKEEIFEYRKNIKIYDIFTFFNEIELLEIRLNILDPYVDYFVIVESTETFTGLPKKLYFEENKERFKKWENKIIHFIVKDTPKNEEDLRKRLENKNLSDLDKQIINNCLTSDNILEGQIQWFKQFYQKESIKKTLLNLEDDDFCYVSDVDEIWNPNILIDYSKNDIFKYKLIPYIYYLNNRSNDNWRNWTGPIATKYKNIKNSCLNHLRTTRKTKYSFLVNSGWHFTFQGGVDRIKRKLESYGHQENNTDRIKLQLKNTVSENKDISGRRIKFWKDESNLPKYLLENKQKYRELFK